MRPLITFRGILFVWFSIISLGKASGQETQVVHADDAPVWGAAPRLVEEVRIGSLDGAEEYTFGMIGGVAVMEDGTIWVGDRHLSAIRKYGPDGAYTGQIGRKGEGPGEFSYPFGMRVLPDGRVAVWDDGAIRISLFSAAGDFLDSFRPNTFMMGSTLFEEFEVDPEGNLYIIARSGAFSDEPKSTFWIKTRPDGQVLDSIFLSGSSSTGIIDPVRKQVTLSPLGYLVTAINSEYAIEYPDQPGTVRRIEREWVPVRYERSERGEKQRLEEVFAERNGKSPRRIPRDKPAFSIIWIDSAGRFWVQMQAPGYFETETPGEEALREKYNGLKREWREPFVCEVIEPNGRYLGRLVFPNRQTQLVVAKGRRVWVIEKGPFDEEYVVQYRIDQG
ncbi:MAG: hypothetical protein MUO50_02065 [Longimicrobiales bacterium]|nr:hypothetical protein [Longimicrobiales bacterium]